MEIKGVEIMAVGRWNGTDITEEKMRQVCDAFTETRSYAKPFLKLGHNDEQELLAKDGLPAAGWVANVYIKGKKLLADFADVPAKIFELIQKKAYRKVSVELYSGLTFQGKKYPTFLGAVALLGADLPAMATLDDILAMYTLDDGAHAKPADILPFESVKATIKETVEYFEREKPMSEANDQSDLKKMVEDQQKVIDQLNGQVEAFKKNSGDISAQFEQFKKDSEEKIAGLLAGAQKNQVELFTLELEKQDLLSPSLKSLVEPFLQSAVAQPAKFSVGQKELAGHEWLGELLKTAKEVFSVNKTEQTKNEAPKTEGDAASLDKEIQDAMAAEKLSYSQAYKKVMKAKAQK